MAGDYFMDGLAVPETLADLHALLQRVGREHPDLDDSDLAMVETAVIEVAGNVIEHGRPPGEVLYTLRMVVHPDRVECLLWDTGQPLPGGLADLSMPQEWSAEHGRGLPLAQAALDTFNHARLPQGNMWRMIRNRGQASRA